VKFYIITYWALEVVGMCLTIFKRDLFTQLMTGSKKKTF